MSARPVLFDGAMVRAILAGAKTQTRRAVRWPTMDDDGARIITSRETGERWPYARRGLNDTPVRCPLGAPGDALWVRETWYDDCPGDNNPRSIEYRATHACRDWEAGCPCRGNGGGSLWRPSIHMPRWASRLTLRVTSVRVERLHTITEDDARAEGVLTLEPRTGAATARERFADLWSDVYGRELWDANSWVWVVSFDRDGGAT